MHRPSDFPIFLLFLVGSLGPLGLLIFLQGTALLFVLGLWFALITTAFWFVRRSRSDDTSISSLVIAWLWGLTWWLPTQALEYLGISVYDAFLLGIWLSAFATCPVIWYITRLRGPVIASAVAAVSTLLGPLAFFTWPPLIYGGIAYWVAVAPLRRGECPSCGYDLKCLPSQVCPECGRDAFTTFARMRDDGESPHDIYRAAKAAELDLPATIRMLRQLFGFSLSEAKEVIVVAEGFADSLDEYEERVILPALEEAFREVQEREQKGL